MKVLVQNIVILSSIVLIAQLASMVFPYGDNFVYGVAIGSLIFLFRPPIRKVM